MSEQRTTGGQFGIGEDWEFAGPGGKGWGGPPADPPVQTITPPPLWTSPPDPPEINTPGHEPFPQRPPWTDEPLPVIEPNGTMWVTGAPTWTPDPATQRPPVW
jgi:hypothetical protein